ncbi:MAG: phosphoribosylglycinamide formyltransferase [Chitinophagia bacterium]|nr:phosphoribosylglycinamide formyltransferase [Chitinophagia bacterium]
MSGGNIAIFASGAGSNARELIRHFRGHPRFRVSLVACNRPEAGVIGVAAEAGVPVLNLERERFFRGDGHLPDLMAASIDLIVLAGFLWKVPSALVKAFPDRILNIHPALLPAHGGKGMYGSHVHEAVIRGGDRHSGITIHLVDEQYDHGRTLFQARLDLMPNETPETLAQRIHVLEHRHFPTIVEAFLQNQTSC